MKPIENLWNWLVANWSPLGLGAIIGGCIGFGFNVFKWFVPSRADLMRGRKESEEKEFDASVFGVLANPNVPRQWRGMTGAGMPVTLASEIAKYLGVDLDDVEDSLQRLQIRGRVSRGDMGLWNIVPH